MLRKNAKNGNFEKSAVIKLYLGYKQPYFLSKVAKNLKWKQTWLPNPPVDLPLDSYGVSQAYPSVTLVNKTCSELSSSYPLNLPAGWTVENSILHYRTLCCPHAARGDSAPPTGSLQEAQTSILSEARLPPRFPSWTQGMFSYFYHEALSLCH